MYITIDILAVGVLILTVVGAWLQLQIMYLRRNLNQLRQSNSNFRTRNR